jgi:hypothetical protein
MWVFLYSFTLILGAYNDDLLLLSMAFYFLGLAGVEFSLGLLLIVLFKSYNEGLDFDSSQKKNLTINQKIF